MLDIRQKEEIAATAAILNLAQNPFLNLCRKRVYLELGDVLVGRGLLFWWPVNVLCSLSM